LQNSIPWWISPANIISEGRLWLTPAVLGGIPERECKRSGQDYRFCWAGFDEVPISDLNQPVHSFHSENERERSLIIHRQVGWTNLCLCCASNRIFHVTRLGGLFGTMSPWITSQDGPNLSEKMPILVAKMPADKQVKRREFGSWREPVQMTLTEDRFWSHYLDK
jgi:hypothetical protein